MKNRVRLSLGLIAGGAALLVIIWFATCCQMRDFLGEEFFLSLLGRLVAANLAGVVLGGVAIAVGWRLWLKAAPFVAVTWLLIGGVCFATSQGDLALGMLPSVLALSAARLSQRFGLRAWHWAALVMVGFSLVLLIRVFGNENRRQRVKEFFCGREQRQEMVSPASKTDCAAVQTMPDAKRPIKYDHLILIVPTCLLLVGFALLAFGAKEEPAKSFVVVLGLAVAGPCVLVALADLRLVPNLDLSIPWARDEIACVATDWLAFGILTSAVKITHRS